MSWLEINTCILRNNPHASLQSLLHSGWVEGGSLGLTGPRFAGCSNCVSLILTVMQGSYTGYAISRLSPE